MRDLLVGADTAGDEQHDSDHDEREPRGRDVQHREEDPVVEEPRAEVVRRDEHEHAAAPDDKQRADVLQPRLGERFTLLAQVGGEKDDQEDLRELARLELDRADAHPQPGAVDRRSEAGDARQEQERDRRDPEQVLVVLERAVVAAEAEQREREEADADHDPETLLERVVGAEPVDLGDADRGQHARHRQEVRVGVGDRVPRDDVCSEVQREEEDRVAERAPADEGLPRDVHGREAEAGEGADGGEVEQLTVAGDGA